MFGGRDVHEALARRLVDLPQAEAFTIFDSTGHQVNVSRNGRCQTTLSPTKSISAISPLRRIPNLRLRADHQPLSGTQTVFLVRRLTGRDGASWALSSRRSCSDYLEGVFRQDRI